MKKLIPNNIEHLILQFKNVFGTFPTSSCYNKMNINAIFVKIETDNTQL